MTAVVGILNKEAVAIAADSAATLHNGKIFNKANKIFTLSKHHPVGIMVHNAASFMGTPWETIIKIYRGQLKDKYFDTLAEYQRDFVSFIKTNDFFCSTGHQFNSLGYWIIGINEYYLDAIGKTVAPSEPDYKDKVILGLREQAQKNIALFASSKVLPDFVGYTYGEFSTFLETGLQEIIDHSFTTHGHVIDKDTRELLKKSYFSQLVVQELRTTNTTGLVFTGFGEKEIFPSLISLNVFLGVDNKLRYFVDDDKANAISHSNPSAICTFAQSDVMFTILTGVAPDLRSTFDLNFRSLLTTYETFLIDNYPNADKKDLKFVLDKVKKDDLTQYFSELMNEVIQKKYINPLYGAVAALSKDDLAEMAESLIYLTYLQRRITNAEESVGGPVDVAILSKGDGFIWIKRKHYFRPELNPNFFKNYFT